MHTLGQTGTKQTGDLFDEGLRGQERVVLLSQLLDELLVLVELLQVINRHVLEVDLLGTVDVGGIGENADGHARAGNVGEPGGIVSLPERIRRSEEGAHLTVPEKRLSRWGS